jgi:hypothetical protein
MTDDNRPCDTEANSGQLITTDALEEYKRNLSVLGRAPDTPDASPHRTQIPHERVVENKLDQIISLLKSLTDLMKRGDEIDTNPWSFKLVQEMSGLEDRDGNGLIYGRDFILKENAENHPPVLQSAAHNFRMNNWTKGEMTWEEYCASLPEGALKVRVQAFIDGLSQRNDEK